MSDQVVFSDFGVAIIEREGRFFARYDAGDIAVQSREDEISEYEAERIKKSEKDAYEVLLACQRRQR